MLYRRDIGITMAAFIVLFSVQASLAQELSWKPRADLPKPMRGTAVASGDGIHFMEANPRGSAVYGYDATADSWTEISQMITWGWNVNLAHIDGLIYVIGGDPFRDRNERYDPGSNTWATLSPMPTPRQHTNCCVVSGKVYVLGGLEKGTLKAGDSMRDWAENARLSSQNEVYDPKTDSWESRAPLPTPRQGPGVGCVNGRIFTIGGAISSAYDAPLSNIVEVYDTGKDLWERASDFPIAIMTMGIVTVNGRLFVIGGQSRNDKGQPVPIAHVYTYDSDRDRWSRNTDLPNAIQIVSTAALDDRIYVMGGCDGRFKPLKQVWYTEVK